MFRYSVPIKNIMGTPTGRSIATLPKSFKSLIYSKHDVDNCSEVLSVKEYVPKENLKESIVLRTLAFPINPSDINQLQGVYPSIPEKTLDFSTDEPAAVAGNEGLFEVIHVPTKASDKFKVGDWVIPLKSNQGTWTDYKAITNPSDLIKVNGLDLLSAATVSVNGCTAYQLVNNYIKWDSTGSNNEWIIQNAGTSGVSKLVTQIAKARGIKTLSVIRDRDNFDEVAQELENKYGATKVISETMNNDKTFGKQDLPKILGPNGTIKLALNSVGGKSSSSIARKLEKNALMLTYGGMSKQPVSLPTSLYIFKGLTSKGYWITENTKKNPSEKVETVEGFIKLYQEGHIETPNLSRDFNHIEWDVSNDKDILEKVKEGINAKGKKQIVLLKWK
ncbi:hypothetical protein Kpol_1036p36 [Vanderwaltozyma polyspora DSM 70294]|uniref:Uncharacterized protein n=1 Tax=Vanderwaltozyma polyspora (strain ATCC 22028 / DSM 70294 / BCRC 21397 / CBS 2163 / NBRC 10782 / NRRL Y-8283 / UCD 57-17) TaxID=436907 RepID=A7TEI6_VANPO|nr:uncharacterized protein Kpol_1036p36 [Vanderwaltozyma polyspora DSM 70294]EDO19293.1 hypothetical protein Kpol_1036p36 [Vanderwaltozyma polyspora DSM 70294]